MMLKALTEDEIKDEYEDDEEDEDEEEYEKREEERSAIFEKYYHRRLDFIKSREGELTEDDLTYHLLKAMLNDPPCWKVNGEAWKEIHGEDLNAKRDILEHTPSMNQVNITDYLYCRLESGVESLDLTNWKGEYEENHPKADALYSLLDDMGYIQDETEAGLTIKYIKPKFDEDRAKGIYIYASRHDDFDSIKDSFGAALTNFTQHSVDESIRANADFQARAGYKAKIIRTAEANCCEWCNDLEGEYEYPDGIPENVFARHDNCRCVVEYQIGDRAQDVWTKRWRENENAEKTEERKEFEKGVFNKRTEEKTEYAGIPKAWKKDLTAASEDTILSGTNPEYATSIGLTATLKDFDFALNCTNAVVAYEMRCRGYDVTAQPLSACRALMQKPFTAWEGGEENKLESDTIGEVLKYVESQREGARVQIAGSYKQSIWERKDGHTFIAEKHHENIVFKDPQSGAIIKSSKDVSDFDHFEFLRIDNLEISSRGISACKGR